MRSGLARPLSMRSFLSLLLLGLVAGLAVGVLYGWLIQPVEYVDTTPDMLRADFRTDYVLMVAEAYTGDSDLALARVRLAALGPQEPVDRVVAAIEYGIDRDFPRSDLDTLNRLAVALRAVSSTAEISSP
jgi:hypothetical protein